LPPASPSTPSLHDALPIFLDEEARVVARRAEGGVRQIDGCEAAARGPARIVDPEAPRPPVFPPRDVQIAARLNHEIVQAGPSQEDRKSTRLNSSHEWISYA